LGTMGSGLQTRDNQMGDLHEVQFWFDLDGETVPGLLYLPNEHAEPMPLVLIQHPGMGSKDDYFVAEVARTWAKRGWICAGLDAPLHGERAAADPMSLFRQPERYPAIRSQFANEVTMALNLLAERFAVDMTRLGFVGYSMGSMLGIPAVARDGRFKAAAFCLVGEGGLAGAVEGPEADVPRLGTVAVRVVGKLQDELIPRDRTEALYQAIPGEKDIRWLPGGHFEIGPDVIKLAEEWLLAKL
jgi:dienelactone hydrolase